MGTKQARQAGAKTHEVMTTPWLVHSCDAEDYVSDNIERSRDTRVNLLYRARNVGSYGTPPYGTGLLTLAHGADGKLPNKWRHAEGIACSCCPGRA